MWGRLGLALACVILWSSTLTSTEPSDNHALAATSQNLAPHTLEPSDGAPAEPSLLRVRRSSKKGKKGKKKKGGSAAKEMAGNVAKGGTKVMEKLNPANWIKGSSEEDSSEESEESSEEQDNDRSLGGESKKDSWSFLTAKDGGKEPLMGIQGGNHLVIIHPLPDGKVVIEATNLTSHLQIPKDGEELEPNGSDCLTLPILLPQSEDDTGDLKRHD